LNNRVSVLVDFTAFATTTAATITSIDVKRRGEKSLSGDY